MKKEAKKSSGLYALQITGSKERKSLSGAIKSSKATSEKFWIECTKALKLKPAQITPAWIIERSNDKDLYQIKKGAKISREVWSAWRIETIMRKEADK